jgi:HSP20 family molecular chaperone IbpA
MGTMIKNETQPEEVAKTERTQTGPIFTPVVDIWETENELVVCADLPGVCPESLEIEFENRQLTIHGKVAPRGTDRDVIHQEYGMGDYYRTFAIGESIDAEQISAEMAAGVLTLHLPKTEAAKPRRIEVKGA